MQRKKVFWKGTLAVYTYTGHLSEYDKAHSLIMENNHLNYYHQQKQHSGNISKELLAKQGIFANKPSECYKIYQNLILGLGTKCVCVPLSQRHPNLQRASTIHCGCKKVCIGVLNCSKANMGCTTLRYSEEVHVNICSYNICNSVCE